MIVEGVELVSFEEFFECSDYFLVYVLFNDEMCYMFSDVEFIVMKSFVVLINVGCGLIVDEVVFCRVFYNGELVVVGFDVFEKELLDLDNLLLVMD